MKQLLTLLALAAFLAGCVSDNIRTGQLPPDSGAGLGGTGTPGTGTSGVGIDRPDTTGGDRSGVRLYKRPHPTLEFTSGSQTNNLK